MSLKVRVIVVGKPGKLLQEAIAGYERRAARYWSLEVHEVREERATQGMPFERVREQESARLLERVPPGALLIALTRDGDALTSTQLAALLQRMGDEASSGAAFLIGGAYGLSARLLQGAQRRMQLSSFTLPHELARLLLAEQLYRAGTIARGEPYHKSRL